MKKGTICIVTGLLLIAAAFCLTTLNLFEAYFAGKAAAAALDRLVPLISDDPVPISGRVVYEGSVHPSGEETPGELLPADSPDVPVPVEIEYPDYILNPKMEMPTKELDGKRYLGILRIPAVDLQLPVHSRWNYTNLRSAPCRYTGSVYLDTMVICGHDYRTHFGQLKNLRIGDAVSFTDIDGNVFDYEVTEVEILRPTAIEDMTNSGYALTLFTCTVDGQSRIAVRCTRISK